MNIEVYENGEIKRDGEIATQYTNKNGFKYVSYKVNDKWILRRVHILVANKYLPNPSNYQFLEHIDGDRSNNAVTNLQWVKKHKDSFTDNRMVYAYDSDYQLLSKHSSVSAAARFYNIKRENISKVCNGYNSKLKGMYFSFTLYKKEI